MDANYPVIRARIARGVVWVLGLAAVVVGIALVSNPVVEVWDRDPMVADLYTSRVVEVGAVGTALLCTGLLILALALLAEAYFWRAPVPEPAASVSPSSERASSVDPATAAGMTATAPNGTAKHS